MPYIIYMAICFSQTANRCFPYCISNINPLATNVPHDIKTSQLTGFYMMKNISHQWVKRMLMNNYLLFPLKLSENVWYSYDFKRIKS